MRHLVLIDDHTQILQSCRPLTVTEQRAHLAEAEIGSTFRQRIEQYLYLGVVFYGLVHSRAG